MHAGVGDCMMAAEATAMADLSALATAGPLRGSDQHRRCIVALCAHFYTLGWVSGTGGGIALREGDTVYVAPSGVQKEHIQPEHVFELDAASMAVTDAPQQREGAPALKPSACTPLFMAAFRLPGGHVCAALHSHSKWAALVTMLYDGEFRTTQKEMIKGIEGHGYHDELVVPIIDNTAHECDLADSLATAMAEYPRTCAVLVRNHGVYIWGRDWVQAKTHAECYHYLFELAVEMRKLGLVDAISKDHHAADADKR